MSARPEPLFPPATTEPRQCACGTTQKNLCPHTQAIRDGQASGTRPKTCLDRHDPAAAAIPY